MFLHLLLVATFALLAAADEHPHMKGYDFKEAEELASSPFNGPGLVAEVIPAIAPDATSRDTSTSLMPAPTPPDLLSSRKFTSPTSSTSAGGGQVPRNPQEKPSAPPEPISPDPVNTSSSTTNLGKPVAPPSPRPQDSTSTSSSPMVATSTSSSSTPQVTSTSQMTSQTPASTTPSSTSRQIPTDPNTPWWQSKLLSGSPIPTEYLAQLPLNWPYTEYGIARKAGKTTSWPLTNPNATTQTVAWVYHELLWNPRPLHTTAAEKSNRKSSEVEGLYDPALEGWKHDFIYETITPTGPIAATSSTLAAVSQSSVQTGDTAAKAVSVEGSVVTGEVSAAGADMLSPLSAMSKLTSSPTPTMVDLNELLGEVGSLKGEASSLRSRVDALN